MPQLKLHEISIEVGVYDAWGPLAHWLWYEREFGIDPYAVLMIRKEWK